ncbi:MAG: hypothetical protein BWK76_25810 [Desulfobulbaceae bacterium A2]|nr:MAG: hypothetical protein BWK76_25810 [Desulfobulbaceae bacterium A2]
MGQRKSAAPSRSRLEEHILLLTRYPRPGKAKTRLIPALGDEGAARLQRRLTEGMVSRVAALQGCRPLCFTICYEGTDAGTMAAWLGSEHHYRAQADGNLGERMENALRQALAAGAGRLLLIGADCPGLDASLLAEALDHLRAVDLVLGPAHDGGYYLLGQSARLPAVLRHGLFTGISWGSDRVLAETLTRAQMAGIHYHLLPHRHDIDRPADLVHLDHHTDPR